MLDSIHFVAGEICSIDGASFQPVPGDFKSCLDVLGGTPFVVELLLNDLQISPVAVEYTQMFRRFLWQACAPTLAIIVSCIAIPRIISKVMDGVI